MLLVGCSGPLFEPAKPDAKPDAPVVSFDASAAADELARQAKLANDSPAFKASEVLDGILNQAVDSGMDADFVARVRKACPAIGSNPATDISADQVDAIRAVR